MPPKELDAVDISLVEKFCCHECRHPFYVRYMFIEMEDSFRIHCPKEYNCPNCCAVVDLMNQQMDSMFHFSFQCEDCGREQIQSHDTQPPQLVSCMCTKQFVAGYMHHQIDYWTICKPVELA